MAQQPEPFSREPVPSVPTELPGLTGLVTLLVCVVVVATLFVAREVLIPITLAVLLGFLLTPFVNVLRKLRLGHVPSVLIAAALGIAMVLGIAGLIGVQLADLAGKVPEYTYTIEHKVDAVRSFAVGSISGVLDRLKEITPSPATKPVGTPAAEKAAGAQAPSGPQPIPVTVQPTPMGAVTLAESVLTPILSPLATAGIVFVVSIFVMLQREDLRDRFIRLFGSGDLHRTTIAMNDAGHRLSRYFIAQLSVNATFGCVIGLGLALIGVPSPVLWGVVGMLLRFVPYIGSPIAAVLPIALAAAVDPGWSMAIWTAVLYLVIELLTGQVVEPLVYGHNTGLSPVAVIVAAIFWAWIWGPIGLILSTPMTLCLVVLGQHVKRLEFLDVLLGDRPALTPIESFYQRMLAGDPDEAEEQADLFLKDGTLTAYYDEIALPGLQLASNDALRGVLTPGQLNRLRGSIESLVHELDEHADPEPAAESPSAHPLPPHLPAHEPVGTKPEHMDAGHADMRHALAPGWDSETPVLCVAGRGPLDEAASLMLAQLLTRHGLAARAVAHAAASHARIASLPLDGVAMVCVAHLDIAGAPAHLRHLVRRLRQRLPGHPILVGLWPPTDSLLADERIRAAVGADFYVSTFHEAVAACLETATRGAEPLGQTSTALTAA
ncbi:MAG: AI-2E family transporter [Acetobacteraceae bacterium]